LPFVTVGSLINFCDCLMAGGTSRRNHSEVGSSYIHFNFTPHGDKATPSLIGDVPRGVTLDKPPIFLGGQGGMVGPARVAYGSVIPAGVIHRGNILEEGLLVTPGQPSQKGSRPYRMGVYRNIHRIVENNLIYIGNIRALQDWYGLVRAGTMCRDPFSGFLLEGARKVLETILEERIRRLSELASKLEHSVERLKEENAREDRSREIQIQQSFIDGWPAMETAIREDLGAEKASENRDAFLSTWEKASSGAGYLEAIAGLEPEARRQATGWLQSLVDSVTAVGSEK
jgi:UDP-N-acetylglucosamine/UDP-N-acetylgalactosamine diphosphorylase